MSDSDDSFTLPPKPDRPAEPANPYELEPVHPTQTPTGPAPAPRADDDAPPTLGGGVHDPAIIPLEPAPPKPPRPAIAQPVPPPPGARKGEPVGRLDEPRLLDAFDDDEDLTREPGEKSSPTKDDSVSLEGVVEKPGPIFVVPGRGEPKVLLMVGAAILGAAVVAAALHAKPTLAGVFATGISTIYWTLLLTITGVSAVGVAAHLSGAPYGRVDLAAARMFVTVAACQLILSIRFAALGNWNGAVIAPIALGVYWLTLWALFRLPRQRQVALASTHFALSLLIWGIMSLHVWVVTTSAEAAAVPPPTAP